MIASLAVDRNGRIVSALSMARSLPTIPLTDGIAMVPIVHGALTGALEVRRALSLDNYDFIAVELPRELSEGINELLGMLPRVGQVNFRAHGAAWCLAGDPCNGAIEALRLAEEHGIPSELVDSLIDEQFPSTRLPSTIPVLRIGMAAYAERVIMATATAPTTRRAAAIAKRLALLADRHRRILFVGSVVFAGELRRLLALPAKERPTPPTPAPPPSWHVKAARHTTIPLLLMELPQLAHLYESVRSLLSPEHEFSHALAFRDLLNLCADQYREEYDESISLTEWRALDRFVRNLSLVRGRFLPGLYELVTAAKGCIDHDFGAIVMERASSYPPNEPGGLGFAAPGEEDLEEEDPGQHRSLTLFADFDGEVERLEHYHPFHQVEEVTFHFRRRRPTKEERDAWRATFARDYFTSSGICSWPPEDIFVENFFRGVRKRALQQVGEAHSSIEEFTSSVLDGLDMRETTRHLHEGKIFVRRERTPPGKVGPVVIIWRDVPLDYPGLWRTCLYAENQNESDIVFYSTPPGKEMVGPGITRIEYLGILSIFPAMMAPDFWRIAELAWCRTSARLLLAAALLASRERFVAYVSPNPPDAEMKGFARRLERAIIHIPPQFFSGSLMKKARQCHILSSHQARGWAGDYIEND